MVPNGWSDTKLGDVLTIGGGKDYKHLSKGCIPVYGSGGYMLSVSEYLYDGESVCIGRKGTIDNPLFLKGKFWTVDTLFYTHNFKGAIPFYIYQFFQTVNWRSLNEASGVPSLSKAIINNVKINLPPLPEQRKIAQILSTWDRGIATTEKLINASKQQKKALMQQLLTGKKRLVDPETGKAFEGNWEEVKLIDTASNEKYSFTGGPFGSDLKSSDYTLNGVRIIQLQNIGDGCFHNSYKIFTSEEKADELSSCNIYPDDIIISKMGDPVARATLIPDHHSRYVMASDGIRLAVNKNKFNNKFILEMINFETFRNTALSKSTGSTRKRIGLTDLKNIKFRVPELIEQQKIASVLTAADKDIELLQAKLTHFKQEKKALMQQLLTGKRRVSLSS